MREANDDNQEAETAHPTAPPASDCSIVELTEALQSRRMSASLLLEHVIARCQGLPRLRGGTEGVQRRRRSRPPAGGLCAEADRVEAPQQARGRIQQAAARGEAEKSWTASCGRSPISPAHVAAHRSRLLPSPSATNERPRLLPAPRDGVSGAEAKMKRRDFISLFGRGLVAWPLAARAERKGRLPVVGALKSRCAGRRVRRDLRAGLCRTGCRNKSRLIPGAL